MTETDRFKLLFGPYLTPVVRVGDRVTCEYLDRDVTVGGISNGRIPWPTVLRAGVPGLVVYADLARAVRIESAQSIVYWWGTGLGTVCRWRKSLGVGRGVGPGNQPAGSRRLYRDHRGELRPEQYSDPAAAGRAGGTVTGGQNRGKPLHPATAAARDAASRRPRSAAWKAKRSARLKGRSINPALRVWTPDDDSLVLSLPPAAAAALLGVSPGTVYARRHRLRHAPGQSSPRSPHADRPPVAPVPRKAFDLNTFVL